METALVSLLRELVPGCRFSLLLTDYTLLSSLTPTGSVHTLPSLASIRPAAKIEIDVGISGQCVPQT